VSDDSSPDKPTAVLGRRYVAHVIDLIVHAAVVVGAFLLLSDRATLARLPGQSEIDAFRLNPDYAVRINDDRIWLLTRDDLLIIGAVSAAFVLLVTVIVQGRFGWTIGKALTGLRTVKADGTRPGFFRALGRTILLPIDAIPSWLIPIVGPVSALVSADNRRLGDFVGGTYVVGRRAMGEDPTGDADLDTSTWEPAEPAPVTTLAAGEAVRVGDAAVAPEPDVSEPEPEDDEGATEGKAPAYQPQWDPTRQAYLQWDPRKQTWLQFDDAAGEWRPIG
jgi:uncharacterized RDD family membrane protein YckC